MTTAARQARSRPRGFRVPKTSEVIARWMRNRIHEQKLKPGDPLPSEADLQVQFDVSRPTVREAMRILEAQQLVRIARGATGGARYALPEIGMVAEHTGIYLEAHHTTQNDLTEARLQIEPHVVGFIATRAASADLTDLRALAVEQREAIGDLQRFNRAHEQFYEALAALCPNQTLALFLLIFREIMAVQTEVVGDAVAVRGGARGFEAHVRAKEQLVELIAAGDREAAESLWRRHLEAQMKALEVTGRGDMLLKTR